MSVTAPRPNSVTADTYQRLLHFYATQMQCLDLGEIDKWVSPFTVDGVFDANAQPEPARGREAIGAAARGMADDLARRGVVQRHWIGNLVVLAVDDDGLIRTRSYAQVVDAQAGGPTKLRLSAVCEDVLVPYADAWQVRERRVRRDDLPE